MLEINFSLKKLTRSSQGAPSLVKLIFDFLFLLPSMEDQQSKAVRAAESHPKCKRKFTRKKAFNLLLTLC